MKKDINSNVGNKLITAGFWIKTSVRITQFSILILVLFQLILYFSVKLNLSETEKQYINYLQNFTLVILGYFSLFYLISAGNHLIEIGEFLHEKKEKNII
jgi:uncharacterized membrane protein YcfT